MKKTKIKMPPLAELKAVIRDIEDRNYRYASGYQGVVISEVSYDDFDTTDADTIDDLQIFYKATLCFDDHEETYYDCYITWGHIKNIFEKE